LGFDYLKPEGNVAFYRLLLEPLTSSPVNSNTKKDLKAIQNLTPGDFKIVRDKFIFYNKPEIAHTILIEALKEEERIKNAHRVKKPIGF
jgi:transitional endoplasmic reticulum ATPase